jgi:predicted amidohydrolase
MSRVAIAQHAPVYLDVQASMQRAEQLMRQAAAEGAQLVVFGEAWLAGYPAWLDHCSSAALWDHEATKQVFARTRKNSIVVGGPETRQLAALSGELGLALVMGANERVVSGPGNGTLYNALLFFDETGSLVLHRRKLVPTHGERLVWGPGDAADLRSAATAAGRVGGLICWEHWMPLARQALHQAGEQIHVAVWPWGNETHQLASRHYAFEGRCFVIAAGMLMRAGDLPAELVPAEPWRDPEELLLRGGSAVIGPDGQYVVEPLLDREQLIVVDLDLEAVERERMTLDVAGHYARPDLFRFEVAGVGRRGGRDGSGT